MFPCKMNWITIILIILTELFWTHSAHGKQLKGDKSSSDEKLDGADKIKKPYQFGYEIEDGQGNMQHRHEQSDGSGAKVGSYGYVDANGIYRKVEYIADDKGFRVKMSSNEPGIKGYNSPSISMVTKPYSSNELETSTMAAPVHDGSFNSLEKESTRISSTKLDKHYVAHRNPEPANYGDYQHDYLRRVPASSSKEIVHHEANQHRPSSVYPHSLNGPPSNDFKPSLPLSSDSHYSPPLKPIHGREPSSQEANLISKEASYRTGEQTAVNSPSSVSYSPFRPMEGKSSESTSSEVNNYNSIVQPNQLPHKSLPYSQYDPIKREKEKTRNQQSQLMMKAPYELDSNYHSPAYNKPQYPLPIRKEDDIDKSRGDFRSPSKWTKHDEDNLRKKDVNKGEPIYPSGRYHHEPMPKHISSMYLRSKPFESSYNKDSPIQLPSPPSSLSPYSGNNYQDSTPPPGYLATELPLPPPRSSANYDNSHETQLPPPPSSSPSSSPPIHSSIYQIDSPPTSSSSHESQDFREKAVPYFTSSPPPFEPTRIRNDPYSDLLPLPPPQSSSPPPPHNLDNHGAPTLRKRPAAYPPRPEIIKENTDPDPNMPQVIYDSRESGSSEHNSNEHHNHHPVNRNENRPSNPNDHDHDWYSVVGDSYPGRTSRPNKYDPKDESVYINKLPYDLSKDSMESHRLNVPTVNNRYPRDKNSQENGSNKQLRGTSSEVYSNFKTGLRGLFNQINRDKENPYTGSTVKNINLEVNNHIQNGGYDQYSSPSSQSSSSSFTLPLPSPNDTNKTLKKLNLEGSSTEESNHSKQIAPVYRD